MELDSSNTRNNVFSWIIFIIYLLLNIFIFVITYIKYHRGERIIFENISSNFGFLAKVYFPGNSVGNPKELFLKLEFRYCLLLY